ncbi:MAG: GIN domain-containing protein, partial [Flavobacteriales bacterium]
EFTVSGSGRIETNVTEKIIAKVSGSGSIRYIGSPNLSRKTKVSGSGSIKEIKYN